MLSRTINAQTLDALRRPVASTLPDGSQARVAYNALDQITSATDPKGIRTSYVKNAWGETLGANQSSARIGIQDELSAIEFKVSHKNT
jgi:YD repeat-containing protein